MSLEPVSKNQINPPVRQAPVQRASAQVAGSSLGKDALSLQSTSLFSLSSLSQGVSKKVRGSANGFDFTGKAKVNDLDPKTLDLTINASVLFFSAKLHLRLEGQQDGTVTLLAERTDSTPAKPMEISGTKFKVVSRTPEKLTLEDKDGKRGIVQSTPDGGASIEYGDIKVAMAP